MLRLRIAWAAVLLACALASGALPTAAGAGPQGTEERRFADGEYKGTLVYTGVLDIQSVATGIGAFNGTFETDVSAGQATGTFQVLGTAEASVGGVSGGGTFTFQGRVQGGADAPVLQGESGQIDITISIGGSVSLTFSEAEIFPLALEIETATCTQVVGDFTQDFSAFLASQGISHVVKGRFTATRTGDAVGLETELGVLLGDADLVLGNAMNGALDTAALLAVIVRAENISAAINKDQACGFAGLGDFVTPITQIVRDILDFAIANSGSFSTEQLFNLMAAGVRTGVLGNGALDQAAAQQLEDQYKAAFDDRLDLAIAANEQGEIQAILVAATMMGWNGTAQKAQDNL